MNNLYQFFNTVQQIYYSDSIALTYGLYKHIVWQFRKILRGFPVELQLSRSRIAINEPVGVGALVNCMGMYDYNNMSLIKTILMQNGSVFFDVGANIGSYTLIASEQPYATIVSFEPHPHSFELLHYNIQINARTNVLALNVAISQEQGEIFLTDNPEPSLNRITTGESEATVKVRCDTLDNICRELHLIPQIVKIDVEGHENQVLQGFLQNLDSVSLFFIEKGQIATIRELMQARSFVGPYYVYFKQRILSDCPQTRAEDPIYVSPGFKDQLAKLGFAVSNRL